jgi:hypothetical protein
MVLYLARAAVSQPAHDMVSLSVPRLEARACGTGDHRGAEVGVDLSSLEDSSGLLRAENTSTITKQIRGHKQAP